MVVLEVKGQIKLLKFLLPIGQCFSSITPMFHDLPAASAQRGQNARPLFLVRTFLVQQCRIEQPDHKTHTKNEVVAERLGKTLVWLPARRILKVPGRRRRLYRLTTWTPNQRRSRNEWWSHVDGRSLPFEFWLMRKILGHDAQLFRQEFDAAAKNYQAIYHPAAKG